MMNKSTKNQRGFTIAEVSIASAVFSMVLLVALALFFTIGKLFYKGVTISQTQDVAQQILQDVSGNFQTATSPPSITNSAQYSYACIGQSRYTFNIGHQLNVNDPAYPSHATPGTGGNFGLLKDILPTNGSCGPPCNDIPPLGVCGKPNSYFNNPTELLSQGMRIDNFSITGTNTPNIYNVSVTIASGDDDSFTYSTPAPPYDYSSAKCKSDANSDQFCSVVTETTALYQGFKF
jgi:prepilin-type N-terminal cleavage/methylation domain-containing protein